MRKKAAARKIKIPTNLGNTICGVWPCVVALLIDTALHAALLIAYRPTFPGFLRLLMSFVFFIYPLHYTLDMLWSLRPSVCRILSGRFQVNRKYYMNTAQSDIHHLALFPVTVSIPVYTESNEVIFETIRMSLAAIKHYRACSSQAANIIVSDDGLAPMLGELCKKRIDRIVANSIYNASALTAEEQKAAQRIRFYREHGVAFVARPASGRAGLFKKSSNLNYTLRLGDAISSGAQLESLIQEGQAFAGSYAEGNIITNEIILLLDKDSGVKEKIMEAIVPEFAADEKLAYVQCATSAGNMHENYYTYATGHQTNSLFHNIWPCKALQGFFVPLVGHNVFLRKSILEKSGLWAENRVSEDYDKAICFYNMGYHGKYAQIKGLEFTEYASRTFTEETSKQHRYAYGLFEMMFDGTLAPGKTRPCDMLFMVMYFFSVMNQVMLLPTVLMECFFGNIHLLWAGFVFCNICFMFLPCIRGLIMKKHLPREISEKLAHTVMIAVSFVGHSFSMLSGACRFLVNRIRTNRAPFPSTSVDKLEYRFVDGIKLVAEYIRKNKWFIPIALLCLDRGVFMVTRKGIEPITLHIYSYILFGAAFIPILLTPQFFSGFGPRPLLARQFAQGASPNSSYRDGGSPALAEQRIPSPPRLARFSPSEGAGSAQSDIDSFLHAYEKTLQETLPEEHMPEELMLHYAYESCIRKDPEGKKEIYLLKRRQDGAKALLRVTKDYPEEDALEEAKLLKTLHHPGIPRVYGSYAQGGKTYIVREYIEGRSLHEIVKSSGRLSASDISAVMLQLTDILGYLHAQTPPVIHRDIKPQNIIVGKDGGIYLIDFGIARVHKEARTQDTSVILTLDYASPEQYGFEQTTPLSDIYSLGVVVLFMATGNTERSRLEVQVVNNHLRGLIERCIAFNPKARFQSVEELRSYIQRDPSRQSSKGKRRWLASALLAAAAACLCALMYGVGVYMGERQGNEAGYRKGYDSGYIAGYEVAPVFSAGETSADLHSEAPAENLAGNMAIDGGAFAAQGDAFVFYIADGDIYRMPQGGAAPELFVQSGSAQALRYHNGWLYYESDMRMWQTNIYTLESNVLCADTSGKLHIAAGDYYIQSEEGLHLLNPATGEAMLLRDLPAHALASIEGTRMLYVDGGSQALYSAGLNGGDASTILGGGCKSFSPLGEDLFCAMYTGERGGLVRIDGATGEADLLLEVNAVMVNATPAGVYFIDTFDRAINLCSLDGAYRVKISKNRATDFNIAGGWIFYHNEMDGGRLWCVRLDGTNDHPVQTGR